MHFISVDITEPFKNKNQIIIEETFFIGSTETGMQMKWLKLEAVFILAPGGKAVEPLEYCYMHGLWKAEA